MAGDVDKNCRKCNKPFAPETEAKIQCSLCNFMAHYYCVEGLSSSVYKFIVKSDSILWFCENCAQQKEYFVKMAESIANLEKKLNDQAKKLAEVLQNQTYQFKAPPNLPTYNGFTPKSSMPKRSYASLANDLETRHNSPKVFKPNEMRQTGKNTKAPVLVIKSKDNSDQAKMDTNIASSIIKSVINPNTDPVKFMKKQKNGKIILHCNDEQSVKEIKAKLTLKMGTEYQIDKPKEVQPILKVVGVADYSDNETLIQNLRQQNDVITNESELTVVQVRKREDYSTILLRVDTKTFKSVISKKRVCIGWNSCRVFEHLDVIRCFRCHSYGHIVDKCPSDVIVCPKCSGNHEFKNCKSTKISCANCMRKNNELNLNLDVQHFAWSIKCPVTQKHVQRVQKYVRYVE